MSKKSIRSVVAAAFSALSALLFAGPAVAAPITYQNLTLDVPAIATVATANGWLTNNAAGVVFWRFELLEARLLTISATRLSPGLDPAFTLYDGISAADDSLFSHDNPWGRIGTQLLMAVDNGLPPATGSGPFSDAQVTVMLRAGLYTLAVGGSQGDSGGDACVRVATSGIVIASECKTGSGSVPTPTTLALVGAGLLALVCSRRSKKLRP